MYLLVWSRWSFEDVGTWLRRSLQPHSSTVRWRYCHKWLEHRIWLSTCADKPTASPAPSVHCSHSRRHLSRSDQEDRKIPTATGEQSWPKMEADFPHRACPTLLHRDQLWQRYPGGNMWRTCLHVNIPGPAQLKSDPYALALSLRHLAGKEKLNMD